MNAREVARPNMDLPVPDQLEVNIFGPGVGECILVHLGHGSWLMVDSCQGKGHARPAALEYLEAIGGEPEQITLIVATHWHDDHVKGISQVFKQATNADFYVTGAANVDELLAATGYAPFPGSRFSSGVRELSEVAQEAARRNATLGTAVVGQRLWRDRAMPVTEVWTLSPASREMDIGRQNVALAIRGYRPGERRIPAQSSNDASVALYLATSIGPIVLGGDLEHRRGDRQRGWYAILGNRGLPADPAMCFKLPHHGSENGHCQEYWDQRVAPAPMAVVTPFDRGTSSLPRPSDRARIRRLTATALLTSDKRGRTPGHDRVTRKTILESTREYAPLNLLMGHVQLRASGLDLQVAATGEAAWL